MGIEYGCSQCGETIAKPGANGCGYSHCEDHRTKAREFSVLITVRIDSDQSTALAWLKEGLHDAIMMVPDVVDVDVDTIVEVTE